MTADPSTPGSDDRLSHEYRMEHHSGIGVPDEGEQPDGPLLRLIKDRRVAFLGVGAVNTVFGLAAFYVFHLMYGDRLYLLSLLCAHITSVLFAFVLYRTLVFRVRGHLIGDLWRFETVYLIGLAGNAVLLAIGVDALHLSVFPCQVAITALQAVWSWVGHDRFSFRRPHHPTARESDPATVSSLDEP